MVFAVVPLLVSGVAAAAPHYPVENPSQNPFAVIYESTSHVPTLETPTTVEQGQSESDVEAPNEQINHGQFVRQVPKLADGHQVGCIASTVAQSDLGKGEQQTHPNQSSAETDTVDDTLIEGDCSKGAQSDTPAPANASHHSAIDQDKAQGRSSSGPGKNR